MGEPNGTVTSRDFGKITTGSSPREIQLGLRVSYRSGRFASSVQLSRHQSRNAALPSAHRNSLLESIARPELPSTAHREVIYERGMSREIAPQLGRIATALPLSGRGAARGLCGARWRYTARHQAGRRLRIHGCAALPHERGCATALLRLRNSRCADSISGGRVIRLS